MRFFLVLLLALAVVPVANAYTGPGLGLGIVGTVLGVLFSLLLAVLAIFWYPLKRALKIGNKKSVPEDAIAEEEPQPAEEKVSDPQ
ncbi:MAG: hypothetical protein KDI33_12945 [Halioglobus sp.]|nr:hypothetical protein [Halioglobus sp.]